MTATRIAPTVGDAGTEIDRGAFNAAFYELGLRWYWDSDTYRELASTACERERIRSYLEGEQAHMLRAYDAEFLTDAILKAKQRCHESMANSAPRAMPSCNWSDTRWGETGF